MADGTGIRIQGEPDVIGELAAALEPADGVDVLRVETDDTAGIGADFALETVATLIAIASGLFVDGPLVPALWGILRKHRGTTISVETPTRTVTVRSDADLSEESVRAILAALAAG